MLQGLMELPGHVPHGAKNLALEKCLDIVESKSEMLQLSILLFYLHQQSTF